MESIYKQLSAMTLEQLSQKGSKKSALLAQCLCGPAHWSGLGEPPREMRLESFDAEGLAVNSLEPPLHLTAFAGSAR